VRDGHYTGRIVKPLCQGPAKPQRLRAYLTAQGLAVDWQASYAYGDGGTDIPLLEQVGHPQVVYPDDVLLPEAQARGWAIRK
jgi:phosphoserine phosphatase